MNKYDKNEELLKEVRKLIVVPKLIIRFFNPIIIHEPPIRDVVFSCVLEFDNTISVSNSKKWRKLESGSNLDMMIAKEIKKRLLTRIKKSLYDKSKIENGCTK